MLIMLLGDKKLHWLVSRRHWRCCVRSPGKIAGSSGQEPHSHAGQCASHCGPSLHNTATGIQQDQSFQTQVTKGNNKMTIKFYWRQKDYVLYCHAEHTSPCMVFHASFKPALLSVLYRTSPSFRSRLAFSLTWIKQRWIMGYGDSCRQTQ